ncbi:MAG: hypothetical protein WKG07_20040 [Hymenobacter sp.]
MTNPATVVGPPSTLRLLDSAWRGPRRQLLQLDDPSLLALPRGRRSAARPRAPWPLLVVNGDYPALRHRQAELDRAPALPPPALPSTSAWPTAADPKRAVDRLLAERRPRQPAAGQRP